MNDPFTIEHELIAKNSSDINDFKCSICQNIFINPIGCQNCLNHFCSSCIRTWLHNNPTSCPLCKNFQEMRAFPLLKNLLSQLTFKCKNHVKGCKDEINYDNLQRHTEQCEYQMDVCPSHGCGKQVIRNEMLHHLQFQCNFVEVKCGYCYSQMPKIQLNTHEEEICQEAVFICCNCHGLYLKKDDLIHQSHCPENQIACDCGQVYMLKDKINHESKCNNQLVQCEGCGIQLFQSQKKDHIDTCKLYPVSCETCECTLNRIEMENHSLDECMRNFRCLNKREVNALRKENEILKKKLKIISDKQISNRNAHQVFKFSNQYQDSDIFIKGDGQVATVREYQKKRRDRFIIFDMKEPLKNKPLEWQLTAEIINSEWFAIGITDQSNVYLQQRYHDTGHKSYLVSANGTIYSSHSPYENWQQKHFSIEQGNQIQIKYLPHLQKLQITNITKSQEVDIELDASCLLSNRFFPCACLRCPGDTVKLINHNPFNQEQFKNF